MAAGSLMCSLCCTRPCARLPLCFLAKTRVAPWLLLRTGALPGVVPPSLRGVLGWREGGSTVDAIW